jgi:hypothetical protein
MSTSDEQIHRLKNFTLNSLLTTGDEISTQMKNKLLIKGPNSSSSEEEHTA